MLLGRLGSVIQTLDKRVDVIPSPIIPSKMAASFSISVISSVIRKALARNGVGVEVVVHVDAVNVVTLYDIHDDVVTLILNCLGPWVHP